MRYKNWVKKHKMLISVGITATVGLGLSVITHRVGYNNGHYDGYDKGFKDACNFNEMEYNRRVLGE